MWPRDARARVAAAVAADAASRMRLAAARRAAAASIRSALGSPAGLAAAFGAGLAAGPAARGLAATLRGSANLRGALAAFGLRPRDVVAALRAARSAFATATRPRAVDPARAPPATG